MVSLLSFFTGKKKSRRAPSPPPSGALTSASHTANGTPAPSREAGGRFLSLRHKPTPGRPADVSSRRASSDITRKKSNKRSSKEGLPKLALGWELGSTTGDILGLQGVGRPPRLTSEEQKVLDGIRWSLDEVAKGWNCFGQALMDVGLDTPGIFIPRKLPSDKDDQQLLLALFALKVDPALASSFPSLTSHYISSSSSGSTNTAEAWSDRLTASLADSALPADVAECLKYVSRRYTVTPIDTNSEVLEEGIYHSFLRAEQLAGFPLDSYVKLFLPRIPPNIKAYLDDVFRIWAAIAAHANANELAGGKLSRLLGWWILGQRAKATGYLGLYEGWLGAGRRTEHLFFAWIRCQSSEQSLPTRLLQLVEHYPYGEVHPDADFLPTPPSSLPRRTLRVMLVSETPVPKDLTPYDVLQEAHRASAAIEDAPSWTSLRGASSSLQLEALLDDDSAAFMKLFGDVQGLRDVGDERSKASDVVTPTTGEEGPIYRPFLSTPEAQHARRRSKSSSHLLLNVPTFSPVDVSQKFSHTTGDPSPGGTSPSRLAKQQSAGTLRPSPKTTDTWDNFMSAGFGEEEKDKLELSSTLAQAVLRPSLSSRAVSFGSDTSRPPADPPRSVKGKYTVAKEDVIETDDLFLPFVQDGQLDKATLASWPSFTLLRLRTPFPHVDGDVEWVLITLVYCPPPRSPSPVLPLIERSASPAESTASRSLSFFRRSSSLGPRRSLFGSKSAPKTSVSAYPLPTLAEGGSSKTMQREPLSAISAAPTEYTIPEMGEMVKIPSDKAPAATGASGKSSRDPAVLDPTHDSKASDWSYRAEGGGHMIFKYKGSSDAYDGRVLRLRKPTSPLSANSDVATHWKETLLPKLLPANLLLLSSPVRLDQSWTRELLENAERIRPESRKLESGDLVAALNGDVMGSIMDDTTSSVSKSGAIFAVEIKPKWGFLPQANTITPAEAAKIKSQHSRYVLHRHYKREGLDDTYDPLDLFATDLARVEKSLEALWSIWKDTAGTKNNWRVYMNGKPIMPNQTDLLPGYRDDTLIARTAPFLLPTLQTSEVLPKLRDLQSSLDPVDISTLALRFRAEHPNKDLFDPSIASEPTIAELDAFVDKFLSDPSNHHPWTLREQMISYALSAIFKDCSIFVTIPLRQDGETWRTQPGAKVKIIDLDLKDVGGLRKWYNVDEKIWRYWLDTHPASGAASGEEEAEREFSANSTESDAKPFLALRPSGPETIDGSSTRAIFAPSRAASGPGTPTQLSARESSFDITPRQGAAASDKAAALSPASQSFEEPAHGRPDAGTSVLSSSVGADVTPREIPHSQVEADTTLRPGAEGPPGDPMMEAFDVDRGLLNANGLPVPSASESPSEARRKRSLAPSPSPTPYETDLPPGTTTSDLTLRQSHPDSERSSGKHDASSRLAVLPTAIGYDTAVGERPIPEAAEMLRDHSAETESTAGILTSGTSTPFEEFSTPAADISEPVLASVGMGSAEAWIHAPTVSQEETTEADDESDNDDGSPTEGDNTFGHGQIIPGRIKAQSSSAAESVLLGAPIAIAEAPAAMEGALSGEKVLSGEADDAEGSGHLAAASSDESSQPNAEALEAGSSAVVAPVAQVASTFVPLRDVSTPQIEDAPAVPPEVPTPATNSENPISGTRGNDGEEDQADDRSTAPPLSSSLDSGVKEGVYGASDASAGENAILGLPAEQHSAVRSVLGAEQPGEAPGDIIARATDLFTLGDMEILESKGEERDLNLRPEQDHVGSKMEEQEAQSESSRYSQSSAVPTRAGSVYVDDQESIKPAAPDLAMGRPPDDNESRHEGVAVSHGIGSGPGSDVAAVKPDDLV